MTVQTTMTCENKKLPFPLIIFILCPNYLIILKKGEKKFTDNFRYYMAIYFHENLGCLQTFVHLYSFFFFLQSQNSLIPFFSHTCTNLYNEFN